MKQKIQIYLSGLVVMIALIGYVVSCTHEDIVLPDGSSNGSNIVRGTEKIGFKDGKTTFDKVHSYVYLNTVNTSEPGRDQGCLLTTFGTSKDAAYVDSNVAIIKSTKVVYSTTDKGYVVTADFTFHGTTKSITAKLDYAGKTSETFGGSTFDVYGLNLSFSILA